MKMQSICIVAAILLAACGATGAARQLIGDNTGYLPESGAFSGLEAQSARRVAFSGGDKEKYLGKERAEFFDQHGLGTIYTCDYKLDGKNLTLEAFQLGDDVGASAIFYYYVGRQLRGGGEEVDVGASAILDTAKNGRNLYFYKGKWFFSLIYTDQEPIPDLKPLAQFIAGKVAGNSARPLGFAFLDVEGVSAKYARITNGNALNFDIFPPGVWALAPAGGRDARAYIIDLYDKDRAEKTASDFRRYLQVNCEDFKITRQQFGKTNVNYLQAIDKREGKLIYAQYERFIIVIAQLDDFAAGSELLTKMITKIRAANAKQ